jgi:TatD DNase family protein
MFVDTHAHIYLSDFDTDRDEMIQRAKDKGIKAIFMPNIDSHSVDAMIRTEVQHDICHAMIGLHPCSVKGDYLQELRLVDYMMSQRTFAGIGEVGIDLYWDKQFAVQQYNAFRRQIAIAADAGLPVIIHSREALDITISIISELQKGNLTGIFHCFSGDIQQAEKILDCGFLLGIGGVLTYKNAGLDRVIEVIGIQNVVLETDAPYLSPVPYRGKRNECAYIADVAARLSEITGLDIETIAQVTTKNALNLFGQYTRSVSAGT